MIFDSNSLPFILRVEDVAALLKISRSAAYLMVHRDNGIPHIRIGKSIRIPRDDLLAYLATQVRGGD